MKLSNDGPLTMDNSNNTKDTSNPQKQEEIDPNMNKYVENIVQSYLDTNLKGPSDEVKYYPDETNSTSTHTKNCEENIYTIPIKHLYSEHSPNLINGTYISGDVNNLYTNSYTNRNLVESSTLNLKYLIKLEILNQMKLKGNSLIIWFKPHDRLGFSPIPLLDQYGFFTCWTDRGLSFLMEIEEFDINKDSQPYIVLGLNPLKGKQFKDLYVADTYTSILHKGDKNQFKDVCVGSNLSTTPINEHHLSINDSVSILESSSNSQHEDLCIPDDQPITSNQLALPPIKNYTNSPSNSNLENKITKSTLYSTRKKVINNKVTTITTPYIDKIYMRGFSKPLLSYEDIKKTSFYTHCQIPQFKKNHYEITISFKEVNLPKKKTTIIDSNTKHVGVHRLTKNYLKMKTKEDEIEDDWTVDTPSKTLKKKRISRKGSWEYIELEEVCDKLDRNSGLPIVLLEDCEMLTGKKQPNTLRCNISLASHRVRSALNQSYTIHISDEDNDESIYTAIGDLNIDKSFINLNDDLNAKQGTIINIKYPNEFPGYFEEDKIAIYDRETLKKCVEKVVEETENGPDLSPMNLAQVAYRLFWGLVIHSKGKVEHFLEELAPLAASKRFRRKSPWISAISKSIQQKRLRGEAYRQRLQENEISRQKELDERFDEMNKQLEIETALKKRRNSEIRMEQELKYGKKFRHPPILDTDEKSLIETVIDEESGVFKRPLVTITESQKRCIYQECIRKNIRAPIKLVKSTSKGRGVVAADFIAKEDFVLEYRGELISEREGRERDCKYNRARINKGSFMFYFKHNSKNFSIDATDELAQLGPARLINHSMKNPNLIAKTICVDDIAKLFFCAKRNIEENEELVVDYGERDPEVIQRNPWLIT